MLISSNSFIKFAIVYFPCNLISRSQTMPGNSLTSSQRHHLLGAQSINKQPVARHVLAVPFSGSVGGRRNARGWKTS